ncbi:MULTISPECIES: PhzF family phenazine biosynthesis protein [unclassified Janthinobacterium]|uniref:PhzF family phenazine biosynthesis protein n=1 Tax=unclassified Janthinobacterium TaxID=2610881 RepID=UPI0003451446|nr:MULTISPECIES: PhzF family phenazine biosynthesis isomerase [unclassified Janthinobacterium]MEC5162989.1 PhzF family phenazine biosynthesis protein [Janthinobacterium sp. CG_S6]
MTGFVAFTAAPPLSPQTEFPFAGHPTLGTAHALLEAGMRPKAGARIVQECGVGLVQIDMAADGSLAFQAPAAELRPFDPNHRALLEAALAGAALTPSPATPPVLANMGIRWLVARMASAQACLEVRADAAALAGLMRRCEVDGVAIYGPYGAAGPADYEVRALLVEQGALIEDPVTGSANACIARVLQAQGFPDGAASARAYSARQGALLQRDGRVAVRYRDGQPWIGGHSVTVIDGTLGA